jgi:O-antigen/teichoic acid export membrane protein
VALRRFAFGAAALSAARVTQAALSLLALPILARLVGPSEFGLIALAMSFVFFTMAFSDAGMGYSLVRTPREDTAAWSSAFWAITLLASGLALFLLAIAWPVAWLFGEPRLAPLVLALAPIPMVQGMLAAPIADLQQREQFGWLGLAEVTGAVLGAVAAVWLAFNGGGAWALVAQQLGVWNGKAVVIVATTRFRPRFILHREGLEPHLRFGRDTAGWSLLNFFARQIDPLVIAKIIGTTALGFYSIAYRLMALPAYLVSGPVQNALFTRMVALRDDPASLRELVLIASRALASFIFPAMAVLAVANAAFIEVFLSERWLPTAPLFAVLAPIGAITAVVGLNGPLLMAVGRTDLRLRLTFEFTLLWAVAVPFLAMQGVETVAIGFAVIFLLYLPRTLQLFLRPIGGDIAGYVRAMAIPIIISCALAATHVVARMALPLTLWAEIGLAISEVLIGYGVTAWILRGRLTSDLKTMRRLFRAGRPDIVLPASTVAAQK